MSTMDLHWSQELRDLKTSCKDDYVKLVLNTGRSDDSSFSKFLDSLGAKLYVEPDEASKDLRGQKCASCSLYQKVSSDLSIQRVASLPRGKSGTTAFLYCWGVRERMYSRDSSSAASLALTPDSEEKYV